MALYAPRRRRGGMMGTGAPAADYSMGTGGVRQPAGYGGGLPTYDHQPMPGVGDMAPPMTGEARGFIGGTPGPTQDVNGGAPLRQPPGYGAFGTMPPHNDANAGFIGTLPEHHQNQLRHWMGSGMPFEQAYRMLMQQGGM